jgi:hypothetical protein
LKEEVHTKDLLTISTPIAAAISFDSSLSSLLKHALRSCSRTGTAIYWCDAEEEHHRAWTIDLIEDKEDVAGQTSIVGRVFVCARALVGSLSFSRGLGSQPPGSSPLLLAISDTLFLLHRKLALFL